MWSSSFHLEAFPELNDDEAVEVRIISTTGDQRLEISLAEIGGKGRVLSCFSFGIQWKTPRNPGFVRTFEGI